MPRAALALVVLAALSLLAGSIPAAGQSGADAGTMAARLRYIARDQWTGVATTVPERVIEEHAEAIENYGEETREPIPPPPAEGADVARLIVDALGVDAPVQRYGLDAAGRLDVPQDASTVGWNPAYSQDPGHGGATFFAAHFTYLSAPGVFYRLSTMQPGDEIRVALTDGSEHRYRVTSVQDYALGDIDMGAILQGREGRESITLMTCSGPPSEDFPFRTVVLAERI